MIYTYETVGNSSYLVATFERGQGIVNYQLQMLTNNNIKNIINANKRQKNDDVIVSYNITSKISLKQIASRHKITKLGLINIIQGALTALDEIGEYQLVSSGIVFDEEYIYVNPKTYEPSFIYLPCYTDDSGIESFKSLLLSLIMGSKVETTNDNFVQVLLEPLNGATFNVEDLKELCVKYKTESSTEKPHKTPPEEVNPQPVQYIIPPAPPVQPVNELSGIPQQTGSAQRTQPPITPQPKSEPSVKKQKKQVNKSEKDNKGKKNIFLILQVVFVGIVAALSLSGVLNNENGGLNFQYVFGILVVIAGIDFVLYRELFINNKNKDSKEKAPNKIESQSAKRPSMAVPVKSKINENVQPAASPKAEMKPQYNVPKKVQAQNYVPVQPVYSAPPMNPQLNMAATEMESDDTVVLDENNSVPHLEFYENGLVTRIKLDKDIVTVGKLSSQCDFAINNNKISKVHAEFIVRGNEYFVKDCNSTNGTYLNGSSQRISSNVEYQLFDGYRVTLANVDLTFRC